MQTVPDDRQFPWFRELSPQSTTASPTASCEAFTAMGLPDESQQYIQPELNRYLDQLLDPDTTQKPTTIATPNSPSKNTAPETLKNLGKDVDMFVDDEQGDDDDTYIIGLQSLMEKRLAREVPASESPYAKMNKIADTRNRIITDCDADHGQRPIRFKSPQKAFRKKSLSNIEFDDHISDHPIRDFRLPESERLNSDAANLPDFIRASKRPVHISVSKQAGQQHAPSDRSKLKSRFETTDIDRPKSGNRSAMQNRDGVLREVQRKLLRYSCIPPCCLLPMHKDPNVVLISTLASNSPEFANCQDFIDLKIRPGDRLQCQKIAKIFSYHSHSVWARFRQQLSTDWMPIARHASNEEFEFAFHTSDHDKLAEIIECGFVSQGPNYILLCHDTLMTSQTEETSSISCSPVERVLLCQIRKTRSLFYDRPTDTLRFDYKKLKDRWKAKYDCVILGEKPGNRTILILEPEHCIPLYLVEYRATSVKNSISNLKKPQFER